MLPFEFLTKVMANCFMFSCTLTLKTVEIDGKHEDTWSVILGLMSNKEAKSQDGNVAFLIVDALKQEVDKE